MAEPKRQRSFSALLAFAGLVLLGLCIVTALRRQDVLAGGLAVLGLGAMVLAALTPRLTGAVEMSLTGFKMELVKLPEIGRLAGYSDEDILAAIEDKLSNHGAKQQPPRKAWPPKPGLGAERRWEPDQQYLETSTGRAREALMSAPRNSPMYAQTLQGLAALVEYSSPTLSNTDRGTVVALLDQLEDARRRRVS